MHVVPLLAVRRSAAYCYSNSQLWNIYESYWIPFLHQATVNLSINILQHFSSPRISFYDLKKTKSYAFEKKKPGRWRNLLQRELFHSDDSRKLHHTKVGVKRTEITSFFPHGSSSLSTLTDCINTKLKLLSLLPKKKNYLTPPPVTSV